MKKKLSLMLCLCIMALTLAACGSADPQDVDYGGMSYSDLQSSAQNLVTSIAAFSEEELSAAIETNEQYAKQYAKQYGREYTEAEAVISLYSHGWTRHLMWVHLLVWVSSLLIRQAILLPLTRS